MEVGCRNQLGSRENDTGRTLYIYFIPVENTGASWKTAGQYCRFICPKYLCILASCFLLGFFLLKISFGPLLTALEVSITGSTGWGVKDFSKGLRHAVPVDFSVAMETDCVNSAVWQSLQPRGHVSKLHWAAWVYLSSEPTPTGTGLGSLSTHSAGTSAVSLPRRRGLAGLFWADSLLPHFTVIQPTL